MSAMQWNGDTVRHVTSSNNPIRRGIERASDLHRAMSEDEIDHTISPVTMMPDVGEDHDEPTIPVEYPDDDGYADSRAAHQRSAGFQPQNWREYPEGTGNEFQNADGDWVDVQADYFDALYPEENPSAIWDGSYVYVFDGTGEIILNKEAYDFQQAQQVANKALEKAYKGEAKPEPGQQMFFKNPGKGKLFSSRTAAWSLLDQVNHAPVHRVAGWDWDHQIEGYVSDGVADFACICGSNVEAPGHVACECGKVWNSYVVSSNTGTKLICREVPVRENVLLANRTASTKRHAVSYEIGKFSKALAGFRHWMKQTPEWNDWETLLMDPDMAYMDAYIRDRGWQVEPEDEDALREWVLHGCPYPLYGGNGIAIEQWLKGIY